MKNWGHIWVWCSDTQTHLDVIYFECKYHNVKLHFEKRYWRFFCSPLSPCHIHDGVFTYWFKFFFYLLKLCEMPSAQPPPGFIINCMTSSGRSQRWPHLDEGTEFGRTALLPGAGFLLKYISNFNLILKYLAVEKVSIHYCYANIRSKFTEISSRWCNIFQSGVICHSRRRQSNVVIRQEQPD